MSRSIVLIERGGSTHRHIGVMDRQDSVWPLCRTMAPEPGWTFVPPDPASARPMCSHCLKAADRVADLADRQEGVE